MKTPNLLSSIVIICLVYHVTNYLFSGGLGNDFVTHQLGPILFWLLLAWWFYTRLEKAVLPVGALMLTSVCVQTYLMIQLQSPPLSVQFPEAQSMSEWVKFSLSIAPLLIGGISCLLLRFNGQQKS